MELVAVARILARHRLVVVAGLLVSLLAAGGMYKLNDKRTFVAAASGRALLGIPGATASDMDSRIAYTLPDRAVLLADLMTTDPARTAVARAAGIPVAQLGIRGPAMGVTQVPTPLPIAAEQADVPKGAYVANVTPTAGGQVPFLVVAVTGPDLVVAERIVDAVRKEMTILATSKRPGGVTVEPLGNPSGGIFVRGKRKSTAAMLAIVLFAVWCSLIVMVSALARRSRARRLRLRLSPHPPVVVDDASLQG